MTRPDDPLRLVDGGDAPELLRDLLRESRADVPGPAELARLENALGPVLGPPPAVPKAGGSGLSPAKLVGAAGAVAAGALVVAALYFMRDAPEQPGAAPAAAVPASVTPPPPPPAPSGGRGSEPDSATPAAPPTHATPIAPGRRAPAAAPSEAELLEQARALLRSDPRRSLALAREHQRRFPHGALAQEREVIAIEALSRLDREQEARERARGFEERYPASPHKPKVDGAARDR